MAIKKTEDIALLQGKIRAVTDEDRGKLTRFSYSKMDLFEGCNYKYKLKYIDGNYDTPNEIHLYIGNLLHKIAEIKGRDKIENKETDYDYLADILENGIKEKTEKGTEKIEGLKFIRKEFFEEFYKRDENSGLNYKEKCELFINKVIREEMEEDKWRVLAVEKPFEFVYKYGENEDGSPKEVIIMGFVDRWDFCETDENGVPTKIRVLDYKSSKKVFQKDKLPTAMQMVVYSLACYFEYGILPIEHQYDFILLDEKQTALTSGWLKRGLTKLNKTFLKEEELIESGIYVPKPTPLCYFCPYSKTNPKAPSDLKNLCEYHSLWTRDNRNYNVNKKFEIETKEESQELRSVTTESKTIERPQKRKLVF